MIRFDNKCPYRLECENYDENSETCNRATDRSYCGKYREFEEFYYGE